MITSSIASNGFTSRLNMAKIDSDAGKAEEAAQQYVRCTLSFTWPGASRAVKGQLHQDVVDTLDAQATSVSASTKMYNWRNPALSAIRAIKTEIGAYVRRLTIDWPEESGTRLLPRAKLDEFERQMQAYSDLLKDAARAVQGEREQIVKAAQEQRGKAFSPLDYPSDLGSLFSLTWSYSSLKISEELKAISATAYAAERTRQTARLLGAIRLTEEQSIRELHELAGKLSARLDAIDASLAPNESRLPFTASAVDAVGEFCAHFSQVVCWGCDDVREIVEEAGGVVDGVDIDDLRKDATLRQTVSERLSIVASRLADLVPALTSVRYPGTTTRDKATQMRKVE